MFLHLKLISFLEIASCHCCGSVDIGYVTSILRPGQFSIPRIFGVLIKYISPYMPCTLKIISPIFQNFPINFKIVIRKEVQTTWEQWPGSNCSNRRSFEQQINEQIRYAVQLYQFRMSFQLYSHNFTSQTENGNVWGNL